MPIVIQGETSGGGGGAALPVADPDFTIDTTTYDNPVTGSGKIATLVFPAETTAFAMAIEGDAFPRWCWAADPVGDDLTIADGTINPDGGFGAYMGVNAKQTDGTIPLQIGGGAGGMSLGLAGPYVPHKNVSSLPMQIVSGAVLHSDSGDPGAGVPGNVGDIFIRTDPVGPLTTIYRCTGAGVGGVATWAGII